MRLTERDENGTAYDMGDLRSCIDKLADYEDAEEQGLLVRLPCAVGTTFYFIKAYCSYDDEEKYGADVFQLQHLESVTKNLGKTVFLTREKAEQALGGKI